MTALEYQDLARGQCTLCEDTCTLHAKCPLCSGWGVEMLSRAEKIRYMETLDERLLPPACTGCGGAGWVPAEEAGALDLVAMARRGEGLEEAAA